MKLSSFLPRTRSKSIFVVVMASYSLFAAGLLGSVMQAFGAPRPPLDALLRHGYPALAVVSHLILAPVIESLLLIGMIELLRWLRSPTWLQISLSALIFASLHMPVSYAIAVAPSWFIMAAAYLMWRRASRTLGFIVIASIHALFNLNGSIWTIGYAIHHQGA